MLFSILSENFIKKFSETKQYMLKKRKTPVLHGGNLLRFLENNELIADVSAVFDGNIIRRQMEFDCFTGIDVIDVLFHQSQQLSTLFPDEGSSRHVIQMLFRIVPDTSADAQQTRFRIY